MEKTQRSRTIEIPAIMRALHQTVDDEPTASLSGGLGDVRITSGKGGDDRIALIDLTVRVVAARSRRPYFFGFFLQSS